MAVVVKEPNLTPPGPFFASTRFWLAIVAFLGLINVYALRVDLSVALVCMVNDTAVHERAAAALVAGENFTVSRRSQSECAATGEHYNETKAHKDGEFVWDKPTQGLILGAFFWGYIVSQVAGGMAAHRFGAKIVLGVTVFIGCIITFLTPLGARLGYEALIVLRVVLGICQGVTFPCVHEIWSHWAPPLERSKLVGISFAGTQVGNVITLPIAGVLCDYGFAGGWPSIFYVLGMFSFAFFVLWMFFVSSTPSQSKRISPEERDYIQASLSGQMSDSEETKKHKPPWSKILTSMPVWACIVSHWAGDWAAYSMLTSLPFFMKEVLGFDLASLGFIASIPYIAYFACINVAGVTADFLQERRILSTKNTRKLMQIIALMSQAVFQVAAGYCGCGQEALVIVLLTLGLGLSGFQYAGVYVNYIDIAPQYASTLLGIGNTLACFGGMLAPYAMGVMTPNKTRTEWLSLFYLTGGILTVGTVFYVIFAAGEVQPWARVADEKDEDKNNQEMIPLKKETAENGGTKEVDSAVIEEKNPLV